MDIGFFHTPVGPVCRISQGHGVLLARAQSATHDLAVRAPRQHDVPHSYVDNQAHHNLPKYAKTWHSKLEPFEITSSYGLFRTCAIRTKQAKSSGCPNPSQVISDTEKKVAKLSVFAISKALKGIVGAPFCQMTCRRTAVCCRCGKGGHAGKDCKADPSCLNYHGPHAADSKECPKWKEEERSLWSEGVRGRNLLAWLATLRVACQAPKKKFQSSPNVIPPFEIRVQQLLLEIDVDTNSIQEDKFSEMNPWTLDRPESILDLAALYKDKTAPEVYREKFEQIIENHSDHYLLFTDGSKDETCIGAACHSSSGDKCCGAGHELKVQKMFEGAGFVECFKVANCFSSPV
ncbi:hypothetical protein EGW08_012016 [Elysia chlorotica]|uniref:CCHC-type domain-containing protein n=1 Tax=Elysia chlorotica TaxID=188477 RepID=A0A433TF81_ELYCH|nr:hypothetical protein EGW08_012016 [Elysia chlorotica]